MNTVVIEHILQIVKFTTVLIASFMIFNNGIDQKSRKNFIRVFAALFLVSLYWPIKNRRLGVKNVLMIILYCIILSYLMYGSKYGIQASGFTAALGLLVVLTVLPLSRTMKYDVESAIKHLLK